MTFSQRLSRRKEKASVPCPGCVDSFPSLEWAFGTGQGFLESQEPKVFFQATEDSVCRASSKVEATVTKTGHFKIILPGLSGSLPLTEELISLLL